MSFAGYAITLYNPNTEPINLSEIPEHFSWEYFIIRFLEKWSKGIIRNSTKPLDDIRWSIPTLDSGDEHNFFSGRFIPKDKSITLSLTPHETIVSFLLWLRSIVSPEYPVYFLRISEFMVLEIKSNASEETIYQFLQQNSNS